MEAIVYNTEGKETGKIGLPENVFGLKWNSDLVHQVVTSMLTSVRTPVAHTKTRGEVSGGGKKPWQQKGTGRARHGSIRSPIWVGGGVSHGPRNDKNFDRKVNRKMKAKALFTILSRKFKDGEVLFLESVDLPSAKTKDARVIMDTLGSIKGFEAISTKRNNAALFMLHDKDKKVEQGFRNFGNIEVGEMRNLNPVTLLQYKYLVISNPKKAVEIIGSKAVSKAVSGVDEKEPSKLSKSVGAKAATSKTTSKTAKKPLSPAAK